MVERTAGFMIVEELKQGKNAKALANEYTNKLIRQYIPKKENFDKYNRQDIKQIQYQLNQRPGKNLTSRRQKNIFCIFTK